MFVAQGAKEAVKKKRRDAFYENYIKTLLVEAASLGISRQELADMIQKADAEA